MLGLTLGGVSSSSPVAVSVPSQPGEIPSKGGGDKGWGPAASGEGKRVGAAPCLGCLGHQEADGPSWTCSFAHLAETLPLQQQREEGDAIRLEGENMKKQESDSVRVTAAAASPLQTLMVWSGPGLAAFQPPSRG